jgi:hypothetical protein
MTRAMLLPPDVALVDVINRTAVAYVQNAPAYITYVEHTHISAPSLNRTQDINRSVAVRQADDFAVMQDLPHGAERTGQAFPIIPYFDPLGQGFGFSWYANLKNVQISLQRYPVGQWPVPQPDPSVNVFVPYASFWDPSYLPDSTDSRPHFRIVPTPAYAGDMCVSDVVVDPQTQLPSHIELRSKRDAEVIALDYQVLEGHWVITHATYTAPQHFGPMTFTIITDTAYENIAFPAAAPDPRLATSPSPPPTYPPQQ